MKIRLLFIFAGLIALVISLALACIADDTAKLKVWKPDPKIVAGLGPSIVIDGTAFQLPQTLTLTESKVENDGIHSFHWRGQPADDGIRPMFMVLEQPIDALSDGEKKDPELTSTTLIQIVHHANVNIISDTQTSDMQHGTIAGQEFSREYFKGYNHRWLKEMHGFDYATITKKAIFVFHIWDQEPISKYSLPIYEASVLTFHATDQPNTPMPDNLVDPDDTQNQQNQSDD